MSNKGDLNYSIIDEDGSPLNAGIGEEDIVREAQALADARGESVGYYEEDGLGEGGPVTWLRPRPRRIVVEAVVTNGDRAAIAEWAGAVDLDELLGDGDADQARATVEAWQAIEHADERDRVIRESLSVALEDSIPADLDGDPDLRDLAIEAVQERLLEVLGLLRSVYASENERAE